MLWVTIDFIVLEISVIEVFMRHQEAMCREFTVKTDIDTSFHPDVFAGCNSDPDSAGVCYMWQDDVGLVLGRQCADGKIQSVIRPNQIQGARSGQCWCASIAIPISARHDVPCAKTTPITAGNRTVYIIQIHSTEHVKHFVNHRSHAR